MQRGGWLVAGIAALVLWLAPGAEAKTFEVTRTADAVPNGCNASGCTLREAVLAANDRAGADTIVLRSGRRYELAIAGADEEAAATGDLDLTGPTSLRTSGRGRATIDANLLDRAFDALAPASFARLKLVGGTTQAVAGEEQGGAIRSSAGPLRVTRSAVIGAIAPPLGLGAANAAIDKTGGGGDVALARTVVRGTDGDGVKNSGTGDLRLARTRILGSAYDGAVDFAAGSLVAARTTVSGAERSGILDFSGGGVRLERSRVLNVAQTGVLEFDSGDVSLRSSRVAESGNDGVGEFGSGSIRVARSRIVGSGTSAAVAFDDGAISIRDSLVARNGNGVGNFGDGGIAIIRSRLLDTGVSDSGNGSIRVSRSRILGSDSVGAEDFGDGGVSLMRSRIAGSADDGVSEFDDGGVTITRSTVAGNDAAGAFVNPPGTVRVSRSTVAGNGGRGLLLIGVGDAVIEGSTVSGNRQGGISFNGSTARIVNSTIAENRTDGDGGGIFGFGASILRLNGVTVARNVADVDGSGDAGGGLRQANTTTFKVENSLIALNRTAMGGLGPDCFQVLPFDSGGNNLLTDDSGCTDFDGPGDRVRANPKIGPLKRNGGPTKTIGLKKGSPAIGRAGNDAPNRDQRGRKRDRRPDIGAFER